MYFSNMPTTKRKKREVAYGLVGVDGNLLVISMTKKELNSWVIRNASISVRMVTIEISY